MRWPVAAWQARILMRARLVPVGLGCEQQQLRAGARMLERWTQFPSSLSY
jgi:hypothetical protein